MAQDYGYASNPGTLGDPRGAITDALMKIQQPPPVLPQPLSGGMGQTPMGLAPGMPPVAPPVSPGYPMAPTLPGMPSPMQAAGAATPGGVVASAASPFPRPAAPY